MTGTLERDFVVVLTKTKDGQLVSIQMKKQSSPYLHNNSLRYEFRSRVFVDSYGILLISCTMFIYVFVCIAIATES